MPEPVTPDDGAARYLPPGVPSAYPYPDVPVTRLLDDAAKDFPETDAVDSAGHRLTYREVVDQVDRLATALRGLGVGPGERVGLLLPSCPQFLIAFFATMRAEATPVLVDPEAADLESPLNTTGCAALVCLAPSYPRLAALKGKLPSVRHILATGVQDYLPFPRNIVFPLTGRRDGSYWRIQAGEGVLDFKDVIRTTAPEPLAVSTQAPAGACDGYVLDHRAVVAGAFQLRLWVADAQAGRERLLSLAPPSSPFGLAVLLGLGVLSASTIVFGARPGQVGVRAVRKAAPTLLAASPETLARLAPHAEGFGSLRVALADGPVGANAAQAYHAAVGARARGGLAVEGACGLVHADPVYGRSRAGSVGLPLPDTETSVCDDEGQPLPSGRVGRVMVRGPQVATEGWGGGAGAGPGAQVATEGWRSAGCLGCLDAEGYLWPERSA